MQIKMNVDVQNVCPTIEFNYEELLIGIAEGLAKYESVSVTEETFKSAKEDRARINKMVKALKEKKKEVKDALLAPMGEFGKQIDALVSKCESVSSAIDEGIKMIEAERKARKAANIVSIINYLVDDGYVGESYRDHFIAMINEKPQWLNASTFIESVREELIAMMHNVMEDESTLGTMYNNDADCLLVALKEFKKSASIADAVAKVNEYKESLKTAVASAPANATMYEMTIAVKGTKEQLESLKNLIATRLGMEYFQLGEVAEVK